MRRLFIVLIALPALLMGQDSLNVTKVGEVADYWESTSDVFVVDTLCYVAAGNSGLRIMSISNELAPIEIGRIGSPYGASKLLVVDSIAYVASGVGLQIVDVSDPRNPVELCVVRNQVSGDLALIADYVYMASYYGGLRIVNIQDLSNAFEVGIIDSLIYPQGVTVANGYMYVTGVNSHDINDGYLRIFELDTPESPVQVGHCSIASEYVTDVLVVDTLAFVASENGLVIINVADPENPYELSFAFGIFAMSVAVSGDFAYIYDEVHGLNTFDVSNPASPQLLDSYSAYGWGIALQGNRLYLCVNPRTLRTLDISNPSNPAPISDVVGRMRTFHLARDENIVLSLEEGNGVRVIDVSSPSTPEIVSQFTTPAPAISAVLHDTLAYVAEDNHGIAILNLADPANPTELGLMPFPSSVEDIEVQGTYAYTVHDRGWGADFRITNVADPHSPFEEGFLQLLDKTFFDVAVSGEFAYVAAGAYGLVIIDVSNPASPTVIGRYDTQGGTNCVAVAGDLAYIGDDFRGIKVIDISNPASPDSVGWWDSPGRTRRIVVSGNRAFIADEGAGLSILDVTNPAHINLVGYYNARGRAQDVIVNDSLAYVTYQHLISILDISHAFTPDIPRSPEGLVIEYQSESNDIRLSWQPVTQTIHGFPATVDHYLVYRSYTWSPDVWEDAIVPNPPNSTEFIDPAPASGTRFYKVVAVVD